jgi:hypothetical protein
MKNLIFTIAVLLLGAQAWAQSGVTVIVHGFTPNFDPIGNATVNY